MTTKVRPQRLNTDNAPSAGDVVTFLNDDEFSYVPQGSIGGGWGAWVVPDKIETYRAWQTISLNQHLSLGNFVEQQSDDSDMIHSVSSAGSWVPVTVNYWEAFVWQVDSALKTFVPRMRMSTNSESWGIDEQTNYSWTAYIYAVTGTVGSTAVQTWAALRTSNTVSWSVTFANIVQNPTFTFADNTPLPAWDYAVKIEGTITSVNNAPSWILRFYGDNTGAYSWNAIDWTTAEPWEDLSFTITSAADLALVSDASDENRLRYIWQATEAKNINENILVKTRGTIAKTWATESWEFRYLSDTPWEIDTTPWTNLIFVWKGWGADIVSLRWLADFSSEQFEDSFTWTYEFYTAWGWILNFIGSVSLSWASVSLTTQISDDWVSRETLWRQASDSGHTMRTRNNSYSITKNKFVRLLFAQDWWGSINGTLYFTPF